jgi:iron complex transport system permease protein
MAPLRRHSWTLGFLLLAGTLASVGAAVAIGSTSVAWGQVYRVLGHHLTGGWVASPPATVDRIVWELRLPRVLLGCLVGGGLSVVGVAMQALVRNPLAEPYILGISSGATAGASLFYLGFVPPIISQAVSMPVAAFLSGLATIAVV